MSFVRLTTGSTFYVSLVQLLSRPSLLSALWLPLSLALLGALGGFYLAKDPTLVGPGTRHGKTNRLPPGLPAAMPSPLRSAVIEDSRRISAAADADSIRKLWESFVGNSARDQIGREMVLARWALVDPDGACEYFLDDWGPLQTFLIEWAVVDAEGMVVRLVAAEKTGHLPPLAKALAWREPEICLELIAAWKSATGHDYNWPDSTVKFALIRLFEIDRDKALAMAQSLPADLRVEAMQSIAAVMARTDVDAAIAWAQALEDPAERTAASNAAIVEIAKSDPEAAAPLLAELEEPFAHGAPGAPVLGELVRDNPQAAIAWLARHFATESDNPRVAEIVVRESLLGSGEQQTIHAIGQADETLRKQLMARLIKSTWGLSLTELIEGLAGVRSAEVRAEMRSPLVAALARDDTVAAVEYIRSLPEAEMHPVGAGARRIPRVGLRGSGRTVLGVDRSGPRGETDGISKSATF